MRRYTAGGQDQFSLAGIDTVLLLWMTESTCFVLIPVNGSIPLGNSTVLCAQAGTTP